MKNPTKASLLASPKAFFDHLRRQSHTKMRILVLYAALVLTVLGILFVGVIYLVFLRDLPSINDIESLALPESSVIRDRDGNELYTIFSGEDGKRTYIPLNQVSQRLIDAVIATEDKTFLENQWLDYRGLVRSVFNYITGKTDKIQGTSTISQQLIKITFLDNTRSYSRKLKEAYLSYRLNSEYSKEKILELYLNKISFGSNASGVEEASKTFFAKSAKDVGPLGATILASLPKWPTYFNPYNQRSRLMGYLYVYKGEMVDDRTTLETREGRAEYRGLVEKFKSLIKGLSFERINDEDVKICGLKQSELKNPYSIDKDGCVRKSYKDLLTLLNDIRIVEGNSATVTDKSDQSALLEFKSSVPKTSGSGSLISKNRSLAGYSIEYNTGRKDFVATRMLEDNKLTPDEFKAVIIDAIDFEFKRNLSSIKYPHFVMFVQEYLTRKYGDDFFDQGGLQIYTTINPKLQDKAESIVSAQVKINREKYGAKSAALISLDNASGQILSMVGGPDYSNTPEQGQVNVTTSLRQPGSSFKPIVYSLAMSKDAVGPETPIYDVNTTFGKWNPDNYDKKFLGKMKIKTALDYSRNIPAIKMFKVAGGEAEVVKHARNLGINSLRDDGKYGMPLSIGTGELKPIELAAAYSVFANNGWRHDPDPILKIVDKKGNIIDEFVASNGKFVFSDGASYLLSTILSDSSSRPSAFWNNALTLKDRPAAAKTGTSNKDVSDGGTKKILPRDLWTAGYTPQITTVVWAGNVDGSETKGNCDGLNCAAPIWRDYMEFAHKGLPVSQFKKPEGISSATISTITGKLITEGTPPENRISGLFAVKPTQYESTGKTVTVDSLCNGRVTEFTPADAVKTGVLIDFNPIVESYDSSWISATRKWVSGTANMTWATQDTGGYITSYNDIECTRPSQAGASIIVGSNLSDGVRPLWRASMDMQFTSNNPIVRVRLLRGTEELRSSYLETPTATGSFNFTYNFWPEFAGDQTLSFVAIDQYGYSGKSTSRINFGGTVVPPTIRMINPAWGARIALFEGQQANVRFTIADIGELAALNMYLNGELYKIIGTSTIGGEYAVPIGSELAPGIYKLEIRATSSTRARASAAVELEILRK